MKKLLFYFVIILVLLAGCSQKMNMDNVVDEPNFAGIVTEVNEESILVKANEDEDEISSSDLMNVSLDVELDDSKTDFNIGDEVRVYYDGMIAESYPAQINVVYAITLISGVEYTAYDDLIIDLEKMGFNVIAEDVEEDILQGQRKWLTINENENISVYLYENNEKMEEDASYIDVGGDSYNNGKNACEISWVSLPHFYKAGNIIILYVGENEEITNALNDIVGPQFAGYKG